MKDVCEPFEGKRITVMGLGLLGRGVGDVEFLAKCGAQVVVTDKKSEGELAESVEKLKGYKNVSFHLGEHDEKDFTDTDMIFKAAGVPLNSPYITAARKAGVPIYMSTALFAKYAMEAGATVVGITGTRGKTTTTQMIHEILEKQFLQKDGETVSPRRKLLLGGNIRGVSTLALLPRVTKDTIIVLELDSWQLQGFGDLKISPQIAVFTNLLADHQNYYPDMDSYFADKANIFRFQRSGDTLVCGKGIAEKIKAARPPVAPLVPGPLPSDWTLKVPGEHNRENAALAAAALQALNMSEDEIHRGLESFEGVEGRLQLVREVRGVKIYNDNNATTPDATIAALKALDPEGKRNIVLIMGGADKGLDMSGMRAAIHEHCKSVFLLAGTGTDRIRKDTPDTPVFDSLDDAVHAALKAWSAGDILLFSPAFASFGMFKNEYDRNDQFVALIKGI
jgi:UDP-N-acetylmuramoylalanine--D-glutamate ligase